MEYINKEIALITIIKLQVINCWKRYEYVYIQVYTCIYYLKITIERVFYMY